MGQGPSKDPEETGRLSCVCHSIHDKLVQERKREVELLGKQVVACVGCEETGRIHRVSTHTPPGLFNNSAWAELILV